MCHTVPIHERSSRITLLQCIAKRGKAYQRSAPLLLLSQYYRLITGSGLVKSEDPHMSLCNSMPHDL
jgi:hypothetical protein